MSRDHSSDSSNPVDAAIAEWIQAVERGEKPDRESFLANHAHLGPELRQFFLDSDGILIPLVRPSAAEPVHIVLTVVSGPHLGKTFAFDRQDHFLVGRAKIAHFQLPEKDPFFSRLHFMVEVNPPACRLLDMKSTNGTLVNGKPVESSDLRHGDMIEAGDTVLRVTIRNDSADDVPLTIQKPITPLSLSDSLQPTKVYGPGDRALIDKSDKSSWSPPGYVIENIVGRGGMGEVYRARRVQDEKVVAIKSIMPAIAGHSEECRRFLREIDILRQLDHPAIVQLLDSGEHDGKLYFVMEFIEGADLQNWVKARRERPSIRLAVNMMLPILKALDFAHSRGFVHRDLKPGNILIGKSGKTLRPKLGDFGLARAYQDSKISGLTLTGDVCGTPVFLSPEQITDARHVQPASDQYGAAAVLYQLLTGSQRYDFINNLQRTLQMILLEDPVPIQERRSEVSAQLASDIHRALSKDPKHRFASIREFHDRLRSHVK